MNIKIRLEETEDHRFVEELAREAFWNLYVEGCDEHYLVHVMREHPDFLKELGYVALVDEKVVGFIMYTRSYVEDEQKNRMDTITFGPLAVHPNFQRKGIGRKLFSHTKEIAKRNGEKAIIILGHPHNYCTYGFRNTKDFNITNGSGKYPYGQLVYELKEGVFGQKKRKFIYSSVFDFDPKGLLEFEKTFPAKQKERKPSQEEFSIAIRAFL